MEQLCRLAINRPALTVLGVLLVTIALGSQLAFLKAETGYRAYLGSEHPTIQKLDDFIDGFGGGLPMAAVWSCRDTTQCDSVFDEEALRMAATVVSQLRDRDDIRRIESPATSSLLVADEKSLTSYTVYRPDGASDNLEELRRRTTIDPAWKGVLVSEDGTVGTILLELASSDSDASKATLRALQGALAPFETAGFRFHIVGQTAQFALTDEALAADSGRLTPLMVGLVALVILVLFRSWQAVVGSLVTVGISTLWTIGFMALLRWPQNAVTETIAPLILVMALSDSVHLLSRYAQTRERSGAHSLQDRAAAMIEAARQAGTPCLITTLTTTAGFASFATSNLESFMRFGLVCAAGISAALFLTFTVLPIVMVRLPADQLRSSQASAMWDRVLSALVDGTRRHARFIVFASVAMALVFAVGMSRLRVDIDEYKLYGEESNVVKGFRFLEQHLRQPDSLELELTLPNGVELFELATVEKLSALAESLEKIDALGPAHSVLDVLAWTNRLLNADDPAYERLAETSAGNAELLTVLSMEDPLALDHWLSPNFRRLRFSVEAEKRPQSERGAVLDAVEEALREHLGSEWKWELTGSFAVYYDMTRDIQRTQLSSFAVAVAVVFVILLLFLKSLGGSLLRAAGWAAVGMFPTILPVVVTFGVMGFASINLDIGTAMVAAILIGIGVDDTIHLLGEFYRRREAGQNAPAAIQASVLHVGQAVLTTSVALSIGFLALTLSSWQSIASFGFLSGVAILGALAADLWILPAMILMFGSRGAPDARNEQPGPEEAPKKGSQIALTGLVIGSLASLLFLAARGIPGDGDTQVLACRTMMNGVVPVIASTNGGCNLEPFDRIVSMEGADGPVLANDHQAFLHAIRTQPGPVVLQVERRSEMHEVIVPVVVETPLDRLRHFLSALVLTSLLMGLVLSVYWRSKARAAPALVVLFAAMCGEIISVICFSHGSTLEWAGAPIAPLLAASLTHVALTFPRERALVVAAPGVVFVPYLLGGLLAAVGLRALSFDPSFWALAERFMLFFAAGGAGMLGVSAVRSVQTSRTPLEQARARLLLVSFLGIPVILAPVALSWGAGIPGGQLTFVLAGMGIFAVPLAYSITRYDLFDFSIQARRVLERVLHVTVIGSVTAAAAALLVEVFPTGGPLVWALSGVAGFLVASFVRSQWLTLIGSGASRMREGLVDAYQQGAPLEITEDASARLVGRTLQTGLRGAGVAVFSVCDSGWRLSHATRECPAVGSAIARAAEDILGTEASVDLARGDVHESSAVEIIREAGFELIVAMEFDNERFGLTLVAPPPDRLAFGAEEMSFVKSVASHAGVAMYSGRAATRRLVADPDLRRLALDRHATEIAHELGSPLRVLERRSRRLIERADDPNQVREEARKLEAVSKSLLQTIYEMASDPGPPVEEDEASLHDAIVAAAEMLDEPNAAGQVSLHLPPGLPPIQDPELLTRALLNLLDNALQASEPGEPVWVSAVCDENEAIVEIRDNGTGMTTATLERAFEPHFSTRHGESMGLGLTISRDIVQSTGGKLDLRSVLGHGTVATIRLPVSKNPGTSR